MKKFEYKYLCFDCIKSIYSMMSKRGMFSEEFIKQANKLGEEGWELTCGAPLEFTSGDAGCFVVIFKRELL